MTYIKITNSEGKQWILPKRNMQVGLMLYQPSAWKGKVIKRLLPLVAKLGPLFCNVLQNTTVEGWECIVRYLEELFGERELEFAVFMGTPSANRKITVQISKGKRILGYCKLTRTERIYGLFLGEKETLDRLEAAGIGNMPHCIDCRRLENGYYAFVQSTKKTVHSTVSHRLDERHYEFVRQLAEKTAVKMPYRESDFGKMMRSLREHLGSFDSKDGKAIEKALDRIDEYYKDKTTFCTYHGDFTPWNTCNVDGELFVFDWEYAAKSCPPYMDLMHFVGQVGIFEHVDLNSNERFCNLLQNTSNNAMLRLSYLLYIFTLYNGLYNWHWDKDDRCYVAWMRQIKHFLLGN